MSGESPIYRSEAVDSMTAPSRLNAVAPLTSPRLWVVLAAAASLVITGLLWAGLGRINLSVHGMGVLVRGTHVAVAKSIATGQVAEVVVAPGAVVRAGDALVTFTLPVQSAEAHEALRRVETLRSQDQALRAREDEALARVRSALDAQSAALRSLVDRLAELLPQHQQQVELSRRLKGDGIVGERDYLEAVSDALVVERSLLETRAQLEQLARERAQFEIATETARGVRLDSILQAEGTAAEVQARFDRDRTVRAPESGRIVQVLAFPGLSVDAGDPLIIISGGAEGAMRCLAFFPLATGKRLTPGMTAHVSPSVAPRERFGSVLGTVELADSFAGTQDSVVDRIHSTEWAGELRQRYGATIGAMVALEPGATATGLAWTSGAGYGEPLTEGTIAEVDVIAEQERPISLVLPWLRGLFGR